MKFLSYIKDKLYAIILIFLTYVLLLLLCIAYKVNLSLIISFYIILTLALLSVLLISYYRKRTFYESLQENIKMLDQAYLILETIEKPEFYEGKILYESLYEINKSMLENVKKYNTQVNDFKEYIEMWLHEIKIPLSSLILLSHNHKSELNDKILLQLQKIDDYLEQILYYVRSENASKDYLINKVSIKECVKKVALRNKDHLLESKINLEVSNLNYDVYTDSKWLEFILNQIVNNSIKYKDENKESYIKIYAIKNTSAVSLFIEDNGIGIDPSDIKRVFEKSFTGKNGRVSSASTGMGLFIVKNLCDKLGHKITIESTPKEYTKVIITISTNKFYEVAR